MQKDGRSVFAFGKGCFAEGIDENNVGAFDIGIDLIGRHRYDRHACDPKAKMSGLRKIGVSTKINDFL